LESSSGGGSIPEAKVSPKRTPDNQQELWEAHVRTWQPKLQHALERYQDLHQDEDFQRRIEVLTTLKSAIIS
jgi:primosomal protein N''